MIDPVTLDWAKMDGLVPAIVQSPTGRVLMLGYMDRAALARTIESGDVTFFSRSKQHLWTKGETSGNRLRLVAIATDCDRDALLITAEPQGPPCHLGTESCFGETSGPFFPGRLEVIAAERAKADPAQSYTARLAVEGIKRIAQKVGEEGVEVALAATSGSPEEMVEEAADLAFHLTLLLQQSGRSWSDVTAILEQRHAASNATASS